MKRFRFIAAFMAMIIWCSAVMVYAAEPEDTSVLLADEMTEVSEDGTLSDANFVGEINYDDNTVTIIGVRDDVSEVKNPKIPAKMGSYKVTSVGYEAFEGEKRLTGTLSFEEGIKEIGTEAFRNCTGLTSVTFPASLTSLNSYAFYNCKGLTGSVTIPEGVTYIGGDEDYWDDADGINYDGVLYGAPFNGCTGITEFVNNSDQILGLPSTYLGDDKEYVWVNKSDLSVIEEVWIKKGTAVRKEFIRAEEGNFKYSYVDGAAVATVTGLIDKVSALDNPSIPATIGGKAVTEIGYGAFDDRDGLAGTLTLPEGLKTIGSRAFYDCDNLTGTIPIPATVTEIGSGAFKSCEGFTGTVTIPAGVETIGWDVLDGCTGITEVVNNSKESISLPSEKGYVWISKSGKSISSIRKGTATKIKKETGVVSDDYYRASVNDVDTTVTITGPVDKAKYNPDPEIPQTIGEKTVTVIGSSAFDDYNGFTGTIKFPAGLMTIESNAFSSNYGLTGSLTLPAGLISIGSEAFENCAGFTGTPVLPEGLEEIGDYAFGKCEGFTGTVTIPASVISIGSNPFNGCKGITAVVNNSEEEVTLPSFRGFVWVDNDGKEIKSIKKGTATKKNDPNYVTDGTFWARLSEDKNSVTIEGLVDSDKIITELTIPASVGGKTVSRVDNNVFGYQGITKVVNKSECWCWVPTPSYYVWVNEAGKAYEDPDDVWVEPGKTITRKNGEKTVDDGTYAAVINSNDENTVTIFGLTDMSKAITNPVIPTTIGGKTVTAIEDGAFAGCTGLTGTATIPAGITSFGSWSPFDGCKGITTVVNNSSRAVALPLVIGACWLDSTGYNASVIDKIAGGTAVRSDFTPVFVKSITVTPAEKTLKIGKTVTLKAVVLPDNATMKDVEWTSSDTKVAKVDKKTGKVTAKAAGVATITATAKDGSGVYGEAVITVPSMSVNTNDLVIKKGATNKNVVVTFTNDTYKKITKKDSKKILKKVSFNKKTGVLTVKTNKKTGTAKITITSKAGLKETIKVTVQKGDVKTTAITVKNNKGKNVNKVTLKKGKSTSVVVNATPDSVSTGEKLTATTNKKNIATVKYDEKTGTYKITAAKKKKGTAKITFKAGNVKKVVTVKVK